MAKGQKRSNRETKKPKANKKKGAPATASVSSALAGKKPAAGPSSPAK